MTGSLASKFGRIIVARTAVAFLCCCIIISSFMTTVFGYITVRCITGIFDGMYVCMLNILNLEIVGTKARSIINFWHGAIFSVGGVLLSYPFAYLFTAVNFGPNLGY